MKYLPDQVFREEQKHLTFGEDLTRAGAILLAFLTTIAGFAWPVLFPAAALLLLCSAHIRTRATHRYQHHQLAILLQQRLPKSD